MKKIFFLILLFSTFAFSDKIVTIKQTDTAYSIGKNTEYLVDEKNSMSVAQVRKSKFTPYNKNLLNFGFLSPVYWFKFQFTFDEFVSENDWWLNIDYPLLDYVTLYIYNTNGTLVSHKHEGDLNQIHTKDTKQNSNLFRLPHKVSENYTAYIRVETSSSMFVPLYIMSSDKLLQKTHLKQTLSGMYYGILLILILYNAITFAYTREKIYALYVFFVIFYAIWQLSFDGLGVLYFWGDSCWMREKATSLFIYTGTFFFLLFSQSLLNAKENIPRFNKYILQPLRYITIFGIFATILFPYKYTIVLGAILSMTVPATLFASGLMVLKKDYYSIRLFVLGWGVFLVGTILFAMSKFNLIEGYIIAKYGQQIGSAVEMILLSGALAQRFNRLRDEYTNKLKNHNTDLEKKVQLALKQERKKEKMLIEQSRLASMGEMIEQIAHQWRQPLNNIGLINQDLYFKNLLGNLTDKDFDSMHIQIDENIAYMSSTINDFRAYYKGDTNKEVYYLNNAIDIILNILEATLKHFKIKITLDIEDGLKVYNVKNNLFQVFINILNNAKDSLIINKIQDKKISIKLTSDNEFAYISIEDNGGGIPTQIFDKIFDSYFTTKIDNDGTGIGLYMSKEIIEKNMNGELIAKNIEHGASFTIKLPLTDKEISKEA